jgi:hypothetical protein
MFVHLDSFRIVTASLFADQSETRWTRHIHLTPAVLKEAKLQARDLAAITKADFKFSGFDSNQVRRIVQAIWSRPSCLPEDPSRAPWAFPGLPVSSRRRISYMRLMFSPNPMLFSQKSTYTPLSLKTHTSLTSTVQALPLLAKPLPGKIFAWSMMELLSMDSLLTLLDEIHDTETKLICA